MTPTPRQLLAAATTVLANDEPVLDGRRSVTAAALARQAVETSLEAWLAERGVPDLRNKRAEFLCLRALHPQPDSVSELYFVWTQLSGACHAISYELPPTHQELERWIATVGRFVHPDQAGPA
jgi:hypothetical protein